MFARLVSMTCCQRSSRERIPRLRTSPGSFDWRSWPEPFWDRSHRRTFSYINDWREDGRGGSPLKPSLWNKLHGEQWSIQAPIAFAVSTCLHQLSDRRAKKVNSILFSFEFFCNWIQLVAVEISSDAASMTKNFSMQSSLWLATTHWASVSSSVDQF